MGRIVTPKYRIEYSVSGAYFTPVGWNSKHAGRPTDENLAKHMQTFIESLKPSGVNAHVSEGLGFIALPHAAKIVRQSDDVVVASWKAPMFMLI